MPLFLYEACQVDQANALCLSARSCFLTVSCNIFVKNRTKLTSCAGACEQYADGVWSFLQKNVECVCRILDLDPLMFTSYANIGEIVVPVIFELMSKVIRFAVANTNFQNRYTLTSQTFPSCTWINICNILGARSRWKLRLLSGNIRLFRSSSNIVYSRDRLISLFKWVDVHRTTEH